jgi:nucleoside-diphosphate-sugar epimerase
MKNTLLSLGHGYCANALSRRLSRTEWDIIGTTRSQEKAQALRDDTIIPIGWDADEVATALQTATHVLISVAPDGDGDPTLRMIGDAITARAKDLSWVGYLSTTGVYGDHAGGWVDEDTPLTPSTQRGRARVAAETAWQDIPDLPLHIFRLAGIYGPGRGPFAKVRNGTARRIIKENQVFSRTHVDDIAQVLEASMNRPAPGTVYNVCDDRPAPPEDVIACAAELLNLPVPKAVPFEEADLSPMARSFYAESKRVRNDKVKSDLGISWFYPDYHSGLRGLLAQEATT